MNEIMIHFSNIGLLDYYSPSDAVRAEINQCTTKERKSLTQPVKALKRPNSTKHVIK